MELSHSNGVQSSIFSNRQMKLSNSDRAPGVKSRAVQSLSCCARDSPPNAWSGMCTTYVYHNSTSDISVYYLLNVFFRYGGKLKTNNLNKTKAFLSALYYVGITFILHNDIIYQSSDCVTFQYIMDAVGLILKKTRGCLNITKFHCGQTHTNEEP